MPRAKASLVAQIIKNPSAVQETHVQSLCWEDPLEKGMATHSSIPVWRIPWSEEPCELQFMGSLRFGDVPGGPVTKVPCSQCRGPGFDHWFGN